MMDKWGIKLVNYINGGVILFNLEKIIKDNKDGELFEFTIKNNRIFIFLGILLIRRNSVKKPMKSRIK